MARSCDEVSFGKLGNMGLETAASCDKAVKQARQIQMLDDPSIQSVPALKRWQQILHMIWCDLVHFQESDSTW